MLSSAVVVPFEPGADLASELRDAQNALRESEARYHALTALSSDWYWEHDADGRFTRVSDHVQDRTGIHPSAIIGFTRWDTGVGYAQEERVRLEACMLGRRPFYDFQFHRTAPDGTLRHLSVSGEPVFDEAGQYSGYRGIGKDLTERKRALAAAGEAERFGRATLDALEDHVCVLESSGTIVMVNEAWRRFLAANAGDTAHDFVGANYLDACDAAEGDERADGVAAAAGIRAVISGEREQFRYEYVCDAPHQMRWFEMKVTRFSGAGRARVVVAHKDITWTRDAAAAAERIEAALRESEARFRSLTDLSVDWYWQQDAALRYTSACNGTEIAAGLAPEADLGRTRWELEGIGEADWDRHRATLAARQPFRDFEVLRSFPDGTVRDISISGEPIFDANGAFTGYRGVGRDITERKNEVRILALEHRVAGSLAESALSEGLEAVIRAVCEMQGWACGVYLEADDSALTLRCVAGWSIAQPQFEQFLVRTRGLTYTKGSGIGGSVWRSGGPVWVADVSLDATTYGRDIILDSGARGAFGFPGTLGGRTVGVFVFFSHTVREPGERLLAAVRVIGAQVGQFVQRRYAELALRDSEARYRALTELSTDWYWEHDEQQRITRMSDGAGKSDGADAAEMVGRRWDALTHSDPALRAALKADIAARRPFRDFEYFRVDHDGARRDFQISGEPMYDAAGAYRGYRGIGRDISERKRGEEQQRFQALLLGTVGDAVVATDAEGRVTYWNAHAEQLYGWSAVDAIGARVRTLLRPDEGGSAHLAAMRDLPNGAVWRGETLARRRSGAAFPVQLTLAQIPDAAGFSAGLLGVSRDITDVKNAEALVRDNARQHSVIAAFGQRALASADLDDLLDHSVRALAEGLDVRRCGVAQLSPDEASMTALFGADAAPRAGVVSRNEAATAMRFVLDATEAVVVDDFAAETRFAVDAGAVADGMRSAVFVTVAGGGGGRFGILSAYSTEPGYFAAGHVDFVQSIANTLGTAINRRAAEDKLAYLAQFDALTGLPNRNLLRDRLTHTIALAAREERSVGVMFVDLDGFKNVNDTFGHGSGDALLIRVAERLKAAVRDGDTVSRLSGDEFAIVLSRLARAEDASVGATHVLEALARPFDLGDHEVRVSASMGIALYPDDGQTPEALLKNADTAMYRAKEQGRNTFQFFTEDLNARLRRRVALDHELRQAVERQEFTLLYQPEVSLDSGLIVGAEALIRWQHPSRGLLEPADFAAVAEETGLVVPIGKWVLETACAQAAAWAREGNRGLFVAVNVSPTEMRRGGAASTIGAALASSGLAPHLLEIELTESGGKAGAESFLDTLNALKALGVQIAIDDFGSGHSTLSHLKRFPIDQVKIDPMFIGDLINECDDAAIVQAIVAMSHHLKLVVTAVGVETRAQAEFLRRAHCDRAQGGLFGTPMSGAQLSALLAERRPGYAGIPVPS